MSGLQDLLDQDAISLDVAADDWEAAIRASGELLESSGVADSAYTDAMVESVNEHGPYIVVAPGFAFAHSRPSEAVKRTGLSWVRLAEPVEFGHKSNDPVTLVVAMAATDSTAHQKAMAQLAKLLGDTEKRSALDEAETPEKVLEILGSDGSDPAAGGGQEKAEPAKKKSSGGKGKTKDHIMTVCGNGVGTSLFLKNTLEQVLSTWGWGSYVSVEATDTVSARGKAKDADLILTSGEIARTLGDVGVPVKVIENFTSTTEIDSALREMYDV